MLITKIFEIIARKVSIIILAKIKDISSVRFKSMKKNITQILFSKMTARFHSELDYYLIVQYSACGSVPLEMAAEINNIKNYALINIINRLS